MPEDYGGSPVTNHRVYKRHEIAISNNRYFLSLDPPGPVRSLTATEIGCTQVKLSWRPPADDSGFQVTDYFYRIYIQYRVNYDECCRIVPTKGTECLIDGLEQLKEYRFMVAAVNTLGIQGNFKSLQLSTKPSTIKSKSYSSSSQSFTLLFLAHRSRRLIGELME